MKSHIPTIECTNFGKIVLEMIQPDGSYKWYCYQRNGEVFYPKNNKDIRVMPIISEQILIWEQSGHIRQRIRFDGNYKKYNLLDEK